MAGRLSRLSALMTVPGVGGVVCAAIRLHRPASWLHRYLRRTGRRLAIGIRALTTSSRRSCHAPVSYMDPVRTSLGVRAGLACSLAFGQLRRRAAMSAQGAESPGTPTFPPL